MVGCGKCFDVPLFHKDGTYDKLVCRCGGEDGLCKDCNVLHAIRETEDKDVRKK